MSVVSGLAWPRAVAPADVHVVVATKGEDGLAAAETLAAGLEAEGLTRIQGYVGPGGPMEDWNAAAARCRAINSSAFPDFGQADWMAFARRTCVENPEGTVSFAYDPEISKGVSGEDATVAVVTHSPI